jgi:hypothetical protein
VSSSELPQFSRQLPSTQVWSLAQGVSVFHAVQPLGAVSHVEGTPSRHWPAPFVQPSWQGGTQTPLLQVSPA